MAAPLSQIEADLKEAKEKWPDARKIWASGGDPFALSTEKQIAVWDLMRTYYPKARISTYAIISDFKHKSVEEICKIKAHGLDEIMIGIESGDDEVLSFVNKGYTSEEIIEAGLPYEVIFLSGLGGAATVSDTPKRVLTSSISCTLTGSLLQDSSYSPIRRS